MVDRGILNAGKDLSFVNPQIRSQAPDHGDDESTRILPPSFHPGDWDVICQGGKDFFDHAGNRRFRICIQNHGQSYMNAKTKQTKSQIVSNIVHNIQECASNIGGCGFIKKNFEDRRWYEISDKVAREKVSHALRDTVKGLLQSTDGGSENPADRRNRVEMSSSSKSESTTSDSARLSQYPAPALHAQDEVFSRALVGGGHQRQMSSPQEEARQFSAVLRAASATTAHSSTAAGAGGSIDLWQTPEDQYLSITSSMEPRPLRFAVDMRMSTPPSAQHLEQQQEEQERALAFQNMYLLRQLQEDEQARGGQGGVLVRGRQQEESKLSGTACEKSSSEAAASMCNEDEISQTSELLTTGHQQRNIAATTRGREQDEDAHASKRQKKRL